MKDIEKEEWNTLAGPDKVETLHEWFTFVDTVQYEPKPHSCHAVYREGENILGILPAHYHTIFIKDFVMESGFYLFGSLLPKVGTPFKMTKVCIPLTCDSRYFGDRKYFDDCLQELRNFSKEKNHILFVLKDFNEKIDFSDLLCIETFPEAYTEPYSSWDAFLKSHKGKKAKHMRYEYRKSVESGTKTYMHDLEGYYDVLYDLYLNVAVRNKSNIMLPRDVFKKMDEYLHEYAKCILAENKGEIIGHLLLLENDHIISCKYAGRNYEAQDPYIYFRLIYELIKYSIEKKKPVSIERTSYGAKLRRGFKIIEKRNYVKSDFPVFGDMYNLLMRMSKRRFEHFIKRVKEIES